MQGVTVSWTSSNAAAASVSPSGLITAHANGSTQVTVTAGSVTATAEVSIAQAPAALVKISGDEQTGPAGQLLPAPLIVQVNDALGNPISGAGVTFAVSQGGGTVTPTTTPTASNGMASTTFRLGTAAASPQQVSGRIPGTALTVSFSAIATAPVTSFDITLRFLSDATPAQQQAFNDARLRWENLVTGDLEDGLLQVDAGDCGESPALNEQVDDVVILVMLEPIDGAGSVLGQAGPCFIRESDGLTVLGLMRFDTDDLEELEAEGLLSAVVVHEMGHVLGFGTLWFGGLLAEPSQGEPPGADPHFTGSQAIVAFDAVGGSTYEGDKVPVESTGGPGTADAHWRESVFGSELMTGFIDLGQNPLSSVTVASLGDLGYLVNPAAADSYTLAPSFRALGLGRGRLLENDILRGPIRKVDAKGRVTGMLRR